MENCQEETFGPRTEEIIVPLHRAVSSVATYNETMLRIGTILSGLFLAGALTGCVTTLDQVSDTPLIANDPIVVGRAVTLLTGPTNRWYGPEVRFIELINRETGRRYQVMVESEDRQFAVEMPAGSMS